MLTILDLIEQVKVLLDTSVIMSITEAGPGSKLRSDITKEQQLEAQQFVQTYLGILEQITAAVSELKDRNNSLYESLQEDTQKINGLEDQIQKATQEIEELEADKTALNEALEENNNKIYELEDLNGSRYEYLQDAQNEINVLKQQIAERQKMLENKNQELSIANEQLIYNDELANKKIMQQQSEIEAKDREIRALKYALLQKDFTMKLAEINQVPTSVTIAAAGINIGSSPQLTFGFNADQSIPQREVPNIIRSPSHTIEESSSSSSSKRKRHRSDSEESNKHFKM